VSDLADGIIVTENVCCLKTANTNNNCCAKSDNIPKLVWAVGFAHEQSLRDATLACPASGILKQPEYKQHKSEPCPCRLRMIAGDSHYFLRMSVYFHEIFDGWQTDLSVLFSQPIQTVKDCVIVVQRESFETPISRLPLRLHLLLLVLLN
jgi:hypothetical protein